MAAARARSRNGRSAVEASPDVLGNEGRAAVLARLLAGAAERVFELEAIRVANAHELDDPVAGLSQTRSDGTVNSYRLCIAEAKEQETRLADAYPELIDRVRELVTRRGV